MEFPRNKEETMFATLGGGKLMDEENELIQAPEDEEDFDVLNEETFGGLEDGEFDWEDEHNRMACELEGSTFFEPDENRTRDSGFATMDKGYSTITQEDELEQSINRLMVEDGDAKNFFTATGRPIPGAQRRSHMDSHVEYKSLGSPGKNIWGSPSDSPFQKPVNNKLQALFASAKQAAHRDFPGVFGIAKPVAPQGSMPSVPIPSEAPTLAEIEHNMMARENQKPKVLTAEEVERQLRGDPPFGPEMSGSMPIQIPPVGTSVAFRNHSAQGPPMGMGPQIPNGESAPINIVPRADRMSGLQGSQGSPVIPVGRSPSPSHHMHPALVAQSPRLIAPYGPAAAVFMVNRLMRPPPPNVVSPFGSPYGSPNVPAAVLASRIPAVPGPMPDQAPPPNNLPRMNFPVGPLPHPVQRQMHPMVPSQHHPNQGHVDNANNMTHHPPASERNKNNRGAYHYQNRAYNDNVNISNNQDDDDEYAGLMSKREKDWIIKIQLMQLQTDNPYLDDYYFTYHTLKKATSQQEANTDLPDLELLIPTMTKMEHRTYTPAQFEGSLGRLTAASVHNPRQIIDVCRNNNNSSPTSDGQKSVSKELRRYRQLLMDIEKGFGVILDVDDLEKKVMALPVENRLPLFEERREKIELVFSYFMQDDSLKNFVPTLTVRKGRKLLARLMPLLNKVQWLSISTVLLSHLPTLIRKDTDEEGLCVLMRPLRRYLNHCNLECLVHFATILQKHPEQNEEGLLLLLHNSFGISLLSCLLKSGEEIFKSTSPVDIDNQLKTQWHHFIEEFIETLESVPKEKLAWPDTHHPLVSDHVDRFINNKQIGAVEDKLAHFSKPRPKDSDENNALMGDGKRRQVMAS